MKEDNDNAEPAPSSVAASISSARADSRLEGMARAAEENDRGFRRGLNHFPSAMPQMLVALDFSLTKPKQIVIAGKPGRTGYARPARGSPPALSAEQDRAAGRRRRRQKYLGENWKS